MKYFEKSVEIIKSRVLNVVRPSDFKQLGADFDELVKFIKDVNRLKDIHDDNFTVIRTNSGLVLSAKQLSEFELPSMFKPLIMPRSIRFSLDSLPKHPDLKNYEILGKSCDVINQEMGVINDTIERFKAIMGNNKYTISNFKVGDVWKDQILSDVLSHVTIRGKDNKLESRLCNLTQVDNTKIPCPVIDITNIINPFNYSGSIDQWVELFKIAYQLPLSGK